MTSKDVKNEILNGIFRSKDGLSSNELRELLNTLIAVSKIEAIAEHEAGKEVIKAKALRKMWTDEWYFLSRNGWNITDEFMICPVNYLQYSLPVDAEEIDIEITVKKGGMICPKCKREGYKPNTYCCPHCGYTTVNLKEKP